MYLLPIYKKTLRGGLGLRGKTLLNVTAILSGLGFLLVGYDNGLMGGFINGKPFQRTFHNPRPIIVSTVVAIYEVGGFIGSMVTSFTGDFIGRRQCIGTGCIFLIIGAILQACASSLAPMILGRIFSGCGVGFLQSSIPSLQSEVTPMKNRGIYAAVYLSFLNFGIVLSYWINFGLSDRDDTFAWRFPTAFQLVFVLAILILSFIAPESPRWLVLHDMHNEARDIISSLLKKDDDDPAVQELMNGIEEAVFTEKILGSGSWSDFYKQDAVQSRRRLWTSCLVQIFQQLTGNNAILYYATTLFQDSIKFTPRMSSLMSGILNTWFFAFSFVPWFLIDRIGRKPLFLIGTFGQMTAMIVQTGMIYKVEQPGSSQKYGIVAAVMLFLYLASFTFGMQSTVWVYPTEILPLRLRAKGTAISTASNWIFNFLVVEITPPAISNIGYKTYIIFSILNAVFLPIVYFYFKETKGLSLESVDLLFGGEAAVLAHNEAIREIRENRSKNDVIYLERQEQEST